MLMKTVDNEKTGCYEFHVRKENAPDLSKSGKSFLSANSHGPAQTGLMIDDMPLSVTITASYKNKNWTS